MPRAYILSHGARVGGAANTFVPAGKSISFFSEFDENVLRSNGLAALNNGEIGPTETKTGPCVVANYYHSRFEDEAIAQHLASESSASGGKSYYVGSDLADPTWLCTTPTACQQTYPQHADACAGIFRTVAEDEIYSVACRGLRGAQNENTKELDGSTDFRAGNQEEAKRILEWAQTDRQAAMEYWQSLTQATRTMLAGNYVALRTYAEQYFAGGGASIPEAVLEAQRYVEAYGEDTFFDWVNEMDPAGRQRQIILHDDTLGATFDRIARARLMGGHTAQGGGEPSAAIAARIGQIAEGLAIGVDQFTGSEQDNVDEVAQAFSALMDEVQAYQNTADPAHASQAVSLYSTGAETGVALAGYQEQRDTETLAHLKSAVGQLAEWSRSLTSV